MQSLEQTLTTMYLDYVNNFLTVPAFAAHYGISEIVALAIIKSEARKNEHNHRKVAA
jgi:hypothetical protein